MSTFTIVAIVVGIIILWAFIASLGVSAINSAIKPIEKDCQKLPHKTKISLVVALLVIAACAWIYGCSRPGF
jgi:hypothetical protein